jgi:molybdopterin converting factor small subunit
LAGAILARVNIKFIGLWRLFLGVQAVTVEVESIEEARDYVETNYGPLYQNKLGSGINKKQSIWDSSNILLNGRNIRQLDELVLEDGDTIDLIPMVAGG